MSFSSLVNQIKHRTPPGTAKPQLESRPLSTQHSKYPSSSSSASKQTDGPRPPIKIDPAVQRLKELRRQEKEAKEAVLAAQKKQNQPQRKATPRTRTVDSSKSRVSKPSTSQTLTSSAIGRSPTPVKRLTFAELMKQGQQKSKIKADSTSKEVSPISSDTLSRQPKSHQYQSKTKPISSMKPSIRIPPSIARPIPHESKYIIKPKAPPAPKPIAQPSAKLKAKLEARKKLKTKRTSISRSLVHEEYDSEEKDFIDDFIDDDEDEIEIKEDAGYDRDEIWRMFNKGKSRYDYNDYDNDSSDMEADGDEIFEEEERAAKRARLEEKREAELERKRVEEKRKRLGRK